MYSYYDYETTVNRAVAARLQSAEGGVPLKAGGEFKQETLSRYYRAYRKAQREARKSQLRMTGRKLLNAVRMLSLSLFQRSQSDTA